MNVADLLARQAAVRPERTAIRAGTANVSFRELAQRAAEVGAELSALGVERGDAVLMLQPMSADLYAALFAVVGRGMVAVVPDRATLLGSVAVLCRSRQPAALVAAPKARWLRPLSPSLRRIPRRLVLRRRRTGATRSGPVVFRDHIEDCPSNAGALVTTTSGSTGSPKVVVRSHGVLLSQHRVLVDNLQPDPDRIALSTLPMFLMATIASGITTLLPDVDVHRSRSVAPAALVDQIQRHDVGTLAAAPALLERLVRYCNDGGIRLDGLAQVFVGGAPVFPDLVDATRRAAPAADLVVVYGSSEAEPISCVSHRDIASEDRERMATGGGLLVGRPVPEIELKIVPNGEPHPATPRIGHFGEVVVRGEHVMGGARSWHRTGDAAYLDAAGRLWLLGRTSAIVRDDRGALYPLAVATALSEHPNIARSTVVAGGGRRELVVEPRRGRPPPDPDSLRRTVPWAGIDDVHLVDGIPTERRHDSKIDYPALRHLLANATPRGADR